MDLLDRVGQKIGNKSSPDRMGLFEPRRRKAETVLLAWLSASLNRRSGLTQCGLFLFTQLCAFGCVKKRIFTGAKETPVRVSH
jgi:hypothetical protein